MGTFGYGRVSTTDQTTENQRLEITQAGYMIEFWFSDVVSGSAHAAQRPQFKDMLGKLRKGDALVVTKLDRLGRDAPDVLATIKRLTEMRVEVVVLVLGKLDLGSAPGKLMLSMLAAIAELERDLLIERTAAGLARAKSQGKTLGRPPKTTAAQRKSMRDEHVRGDTISALSRRYNVSRATVLATVRLAA
jgi:putative DNA-invertase from lambdoid prophage Rac